MLEKELKLDLGIKGKKAVVCASSKGLGLGCAVALAEAGVDLVINSRDPKNLEIAANLLRNNYQICVETVIRSRNRIHKQAPALYVGLVDFVRNYEKRL